MSARHIKQSSAVPEEKAAPSWVATLYEYVESFLTAMILLVLLFTFLFRVAGVKGTSMQPNLQQQDRLILQVHFYKPQYADIVVINRYTDEPLIKRVVGLPGDTIRIDPATETVYRNGEPLTETYTPYSTAPRELTGEVTVPEGHLFVMGDNRPVSKDSRYADIGMIRQADVVGKAIFRISPLSSFGGLYSDVE